MQSYNGSIKLFSTWMSEMNLPDFSKFIIKECVTPGAFQVYVDEAEEKDLLETFKDIGVSNKLKFKQLMTEFRKWNLSINSLGNSEYSDEDRIKILASMSSKELTRMFNAIGMKRAASIVKKEKYKGENLVSDDLSMDDIFQALDIPDDEVYYEIKISQLSHYLKETCWLKEHRKKFKIGSIVYYDHPDEKEPMKKKIIKIENTLNVKNSEGEKHCQNQYFEFPNYLLVSSEFQSKKKVNKEFPEFQNNKIFNDKGKVFTNIDLFTDDGWRRWQENIEYVIKNKSFYNKTFKKDIGCKSILSSKFLKEHFGVISGCAIWKISEE